MKQNIAILLVFWLSSLGVLAQTKTENYIKTTQPKGPTTLQVAPTDPFVERNELETIVYYDGLGRPKQEIAVGIGPKNKNIVKHIEYELNIGQVKEYLPFVDNYNPDTGKDQSQLVVWDPTKKGYLANAKRQTETFYNSVKYEQTTNPYSESELEKSPLKRVLKQGSPGEDWKITTSGAQNVTHSYGFNVANQVKNFKAVATWNAGLKQYDIRLVDGGFYAAANLYVTTTKDENGNASQRFTDQEGKILVTVQIFPLELAPIPRSEEGSSGPMTLGTTTQDIQGELQGKSLSEIMENGEEIGHTIGNNLSENVNQAGSNSLLDPTGLTLNPYKGNPIFTYYVYDQYNNLTYVLPPLAGGKTDATTLDKLCYQYKYDHKNRLVAKKLPGKEWEYLVYDKADRLLAQGPVYSPFGDGAKGWLFSKYDIFGRVVYTGYYAGTPTTEAGRATFQTAVDAGADYHEKRAIATTIDQVAVMYTNVVFPKTGLKILGVNYYDDYTFTGAPSSFAAIEGQDVITKVKGLPTGSWIRVITTATEAQGTLSYQLYDYKERVLRSYKTNTLGGYTQVDAKYNFRGLATKTVTSHKYKNGVEPKVITQTFSYDKAERLLYQTHKIDNLDQVVVFQNVYDELGRLKQKRVGGKMGSNFRPIEVQQNNLVLDGPILATESPTRNTFLQEINYTYNIRGWLTQVNAPQDLEAGDFGKKSLFAMKLNYNKLDSEGVVGIKKLYNGNIAEQSWKTANDNVLRRYSYGYDAIDRLKTGVYQEPGGIAPVVGIYDEQLTYDNNGNILTLNRKGQGVANGIALDLDVLTYTYDGNILQKVVDVSNNTDGFKQGSTTAKHYDYDTFGNLKVDRNKGVTAMKYNHLNLPTEVVFAGGKINYLYTATGEKIQKKVTQGSITVVTDYLDGFQYVKGVLSFFPTAEGYFNAETNGYVYQYSDHLGNVRLSYSDTNKNDKIDVGEIIEENNYYPFGLAHKGYNEKNNTIAANYKYQYNGKEKQEELGFNVYDYGARNYDAAIGRWM
ncbi:DUF6443 domain-containing protein, partial [Myroides odoratus]|uniref:DUF6443 domain-containing protein n=1 Tax=Myroides odoratus TaxID=256 RepID=UPI0039B012F1